MNNDDDLETCLGRLRPAEPPRDLMRRLRGAQPALRWVPFWHRPWPLAYAALLAVWTLILVLRVLTPTPPEPATAAAVTAGATPLPADAPVFAGTFLFARNHIDQP